MQELINRITQTLGVDSETAEKAIGIVLQTLQKEAPAETIAPLIDGLPDAENLIQKANATEAPASGGGFLSGALGSMMGGGSGLMESLNKLQNAGLNMKQIQTVARETLQFAKEKVGEDTVKKITDSVPGLNQFI